MGSAARQVEGIRKYQYVHWTAGMDDRIRAHYRNPKRQSGSYSGGVKQMAREWGINRSAITRRAIELGVLQWKRYWTDAEIEIVHQHADLPANKVAELLGAAGYSRTSTAVTVLRKRLAITRADADVMSAHQVAALMGVDPTTVTRWLRLGHLKAGRQDTERTAAQGGDHYAITRRQLARFITEHPARVDLTKISDAVWFIDLIATKGG